MTSKKTKAAFRRLLNAEDEAARAAGKPAWHNFRLGQRVRSYGDYLYSQDRQMFDISYAAWLDGTFYLCDRATGVAP